MHVCADNIDEHELPVTRVSLCIHHFFLSCLRLTIICKITWSVDFEVDFITEISCCESSSR
uniref:Uncharacterized protein n=1 Tax=Helianthus annuus TaxID=4232 RepID=A0A251T699_HELAN